MSRKSPKPNLDFIAAISFLRFPIHPELPIRPLAGRIICLSQLFCHPTTLSGVGRSSWINRRTLLEISCLIGSALALGAYSSL